MSIFEDISNAPTRQLSRSVGGPSEVEFVHSQGNIVRVVPIPELPKIDYEAVTDYEQGPALAEPIRSTVTATGLPRGYIAVDAAFTIACGGGYVSTVNSKCRLVESGGDYSRGENAMVLPGEASLVMPQPIFVSLEKSFYSAKAETASSAMTFKYSKIALPSGCPYDVAVVVKGSATDPDEPSTESYLAAAKYEECPDKTGLEKYSSIYAKNSESGFFCYEDYDKTRLQGITKPTESSIWGYKDDGYAFKFLADASKASLEAYGDDKFIIISTNDLTDEAQPLAKFREVMGGDMVMRFFLCTDPGDTEPQCDDLADPLVRNIYAQYIGSHPDTGPCVGSETYVDFAQSFIQVATDGDPSTKVTVEPNKIWVSDIDQSLSVESHAINIVSSAGSSEFSDTYLHVSRNTGAYASFDGEGWLELRDAEGKEVYLDPTQIVFTDDSNVATHDASGFEAVDGTSYRAKHAANYFSVVSNDGDSELTDTFLHINKTSGSYATFNGEGWLELRNAAGKEIYLDPTQIVFTDDSNVATHDASGFEAVDGTSYRAKHAANYFSVVSNDGDSELTDTFLHINKTSGSYATFNGEGWLELRNAAGKEIYLDPTQIVFTDGAKTATHDADGYTAINGTSNFAYYRADVANLVTSSNEGSFRADRLVISQTSGSNSATLFSTELSVISGSSEARIYAGGATVSNSSSSVQITPPGENAYFQSIDYIDSNFDVQSVKVLATAPIPSGVFDPCQKVVTCVTDSEIFPTWTETNANYVDWSSFSQVPAYIESKIINALLGLGVDATCDSSGNITVTLTGLPSTSSNTPNWPSAPGTLT